MAPHAVQRKLFFFAALSWGSMCGSACAPNVALDANVVLDANVDQLDAGVDVDSRDAGSSSLDARLSLDAIMRVDAAHDARMGDVGTDPYELQIHFDDVALAAIDPNTLFAHASPCRPAQRVRVTAATDGDTITVVSTDGTVTERVRLLTVNTPEVAHTSSEVDECYGAEGRSFTRQLIGHYVWLTFDVVCVDQFQRTLAFVHTGPNAGGGLWQRQLLRRGLAHAYPVGRNLAFAQTAASDEAYARAQNLGLWAACP